MKELRASDFDYELDPALIAQRPCTRRDGSRLMVLRRGRGAPAHHVFSEVPRLLRPGDLLVLNDTRVLPAKFVCARATGGKIEGLFCREVHPGRWEVILKNAGRCKGGEALAVVGAEEVQLTLHDSGGQGQWIVDVSSPLPADEVLQRVGLTPLPPYIRRAGPGSEDQDRDRYQTVYAKRPGAVAAPTAGLHFTKPLLEVLNAASIETVTATLHVGLGTFAPVKAEDLGSHKMHSEWYELSAPAADRLNAARSDGRRIVAVGTTSVRVLTSAVGPDGRFAAASNWTNIFIYPPAEFQAVDALITNFHLPRSTLLMLVAAFCSPDKTDGLDMILGAYAEAVRLRYRFYSYGDAMLIE